MTLSSQENSDANPIALDERHVAVAIGWLCSGFKISAEWWTAVNDALRGTVSTTRGLRLYYADMNTMMLRNVDIEEGIWSTGEDGIVRGGHDEQLVDLNDDDAAMKADFFPLIIMRDKKRMSLWKEAMRHTNNHTRQRWAKLGRRVLRPLERALLRGNANIETL